jgi:hypothetical protein
MEKYEEFLQKNGLNKRLTTQFLVTATKLWELLFFTPY